MKTLSLDLETFSSVDLAKCGLYRYVESSDFEVLLFGYAWDDGPVHVVDLAGGHEIPDEVIEAMSDGTVLKTAFNANFERVCLAQLRPEWSDPRQWVCTSVLARYVGLPGGLDGASSALGLKEKKDAAGKRLIDFFSKPCKPTKANGGRTRNLPEHDPEKWREFIAYCRQDVEVERAIRDRLAGYEIPDSELDLWVVDQQINDRGVRVDLDLVHRAIEMDGRFSLRLKKEAKELSGLDNPNSPAQLKQWLSGHGIEVDSLSKDVLPDLAAAAPDETVRRVIRIRQDLSRTSTKKYNAAVEATCSDSRIRGMFQFYGANRTGRWAGRLLQPQNLPRNYLPDLDLARQLVVEGSGEMVELLYDSLPDTLSQLIRTVLVPSPGNRFIVSDFSAIEARVIAWLAGQEWVLEVFRGDGKIYEATAAQMFRVPVESIKKGSPERDKGKVAVLACGFGGGVGALAAFGADKMGMTEDEMRQVVDTWRRANPKIVRMWSDIENACMDVVSEGGSARINRWLSCSCDRDFLTILLPSGRKLYYYKPRIDQDPRFNSPQITYLESKGASFTRIGTYGGKLTENVVQAVARDCLAEALLRLQRYNPVMHIHDEVVLDVGPEVTLKEVNELMGQPVDWAPGLPMAADGFECDYYQKD